MWKSLMPSHMLPMRNSQNKILEVMYLTQEFFPTALSSDKRALSVSQAKVAFLINLILYELYLETATGSLSELQGDLHRLSR